MGVSTDAIVFYGYCWDEEEDFIEEEEDDRNEKTPGVTWDEHGSDSSPIPCLYIEESYVCAWPDSPKPLLSEAISPGWDHESWDEKLNKELERRGIEKPEGENQPGWWIASWWG